ncbi:pyridoxamine 5'-phosphate oxidase family protein [Halosolutus amylolyticus]|uniref:Pyridoxamine 5'-phosphate oxidase family protein n=1 Tax=Halosolutus amylolyticus TaxID=2932267 RepID=A0ABD5PJ31_9EURY|nr:pyridoxamine 5'-phosphate oxidase family protein [Halosolutus amylolyticus]
MIETEERMRGIEMGKDEIDDFLYEQGHGILSLMGCGEAYGVPMSFGYDGDRIFMNLITFGDESKKVDYITDTEHVSLTAYHVETRLKWKSTVVNGMLEEVTDDKYAKEVLDDNALFPTLYPPTEPMSDVTRVAIQIEEMTGRKGEEYQS